MVDDKTSRGGCTHRRIVDRDCSLFVFAMNMATTEAVRRHYDRLSILYWWFWGEHIHHGFWRNGESPREAQVNLIEELAQLMAIPRGAKVLDIGSGLGGSALWLATELYCSVLGITVSPVQKAIAESRARSLGLKDRACFAVKDANRLDLPAESFDAIWCIECSEHLVDKAKFFQDCARLLRPRGVLGLCTWLAAEPSSPSANSKLIANICSGMLCPSLGTWEDYNRWICKSGFHEVKAQDLTLQVEKTWEICERVSRRAVVRTFSSLMGSPTRQFFKQFGPIQRAYREGVMRYAMFSARKS
jgi:tocopherol O-methyltransferase